MTTKKKSGSKSKAAKKKSPKSTKKASNKARPSKKKKAAKKKATSAKKKSVKRKPVSKKQTLKKGLADSTPKRKVKIAAKKSKPQTLKKKANVEHASAAKAKRRDVAPSVKPEPKRTSYTNPYSQYQSPPSRLDDIREGLSVAKEVGVLVARSLKKLIRG